jgi:hypothetical protein
MHIIETSHDSEDNTFREPPRFYGLFAFKEGANHAGEKLTKPGGAEADRTFEVHTLIHPGPNNLSEWVFMVRRTIEENYQARYDVDLDKFFDLGSGPVEDVPANYAYNGAKLAMQLLQVQ